MTLPADLRLHGATPLPHLGVIRAQGAEAAAFLHSQLTQDFAQLGPQQARLAAYLSPKGRMLASFIGLQHAPDELLLVCSRDLLAATLKRLTMFVLRAKVRLSDASADFQLWGLAGDALLSIAASAQPAWVKADFDSEQARSHLVHLYPAGGQPRGLWLAPAHAPAPNAAPLDAALWAWSEVQAGVATLSAPLVDALVPQMLNYESVGGVNFKKGCYPGQEVVARSQFRGTLKRRTYRVACATPLATPLSVGQEVFHSSDAEQSCGTVVATAELNGQVQALVSMPTSATEGGQLTAMSPQGAVLTLLSLPYELLADV